MPDNYLDRSTRNWKDNSHPSALSLYGCTESSYYVKGTNAFFIQRASESTLPFGIDDPQISSSSKTNRLELPELVVDLFNGAKSANAVKGSKKPRSAPIVATNFNLKSDPRYYNNHTHIHTHVRTYVHTYTHMYIREYIQHQFTDST